MIRFTIKWTVTRQGNDKFLHDENNLEDWLEGGRVRVSQDDLIQSVMKLSDWLGSETVTTTAGLREDGAMFTVRNDDEVTQTAADGITLLTQSRRHRSVSPSSLFVFCTSPHLFLFFLFFFYSLHFSDCFLSPSCSRRPHFEAFLWQEQRRRLIGRPHNHNRSSIVLLLCLQISEGGNRCCLSAPTAMK